MRPLLFRKQVPRRLLPFALAAFGYYFLAGPMQALIIQGTKDAKIIIAALGQVAYNGANAIGAWLGGEAIKVSDSSISCAIPAGVLGFASAVLFVSIFSIAEKSESADRSLRTECD